MTPQEELITKLQSFFANASGQDIQQFLAGMDKPSLPPSGDDLTPDGPIPFIWAARMRNAW